MFVSLNILMQSLNCGGFLARRDLPLGKNGVYSKRAVRLVKYIAGFQVLQQELVLHIAVNKHCYKPQVSNVTFNNVVVL
jgi:hypothetical protein